MNTNNSTQYALANKHQLNITNSQIHTKTQHSNCRTFRFIPSCYTCWSVGQSLWSPPGRDKMQVQKEYSYRGDLNLENCKMWFLRNLCRVHSCVTFTLVINWVQLVIALMWQFISMTSILTAMKILIEFLISNFRRVLYVVCFLLGNSPASEFYMPMFRNTLSVPTS